MNKNINLVELLKDCPKGTKFYSSYVGTDVFFIEIDNNCIKCEYTSQIDFLNSIAHFKKDGSLYPGGECMLFPSRDQRDWSKWQRPFVEGDVVMYGDDQFAIFKEYIKHPETEGLIRYYLYYDAKNDDLDTNDGQAYVQRLATEKEKAELFQAIKDNGYTWDSGTKTLEKLIEPKFKVGDIVQSKTDNNDKFTITNIDNNKFYYGCGNGHKFMIPVVKQDNWELVPDKIEPKFKVGNTIRSKNGLQAYTITGVTSEYYSVKVGEHACVGILPVKDQDDWILIPNKFNPKTLEHFNKVLVRQYDVSAWCTDFFSYYDEVEGYAVCTGDVHYDYCIPYNEDTKHLVGKSKDAPTFYRYWEDK